MGLHHHDMSVNDDEGFAVSSPSNQYELTQKQLRQARRKQKAEENARMQVGGGNQVGLPAFTPGGPNDPRTGGDGWMGVDRQPASMDSARPAPQSRAIPGEDAGPGDTDNDNVIDNRKAFFKAQKRAVGKTFDEDAYRRNPEGDFTPDKEYPVASDGDPLPGEATMSKGSPEPQANADQKDAAKQTTGQNAPSSGMSMSGSLSMARSFAMNNPVLVGGGALALAALLMLV